MTDDEAIEIARAEHERRGRNFAPPISVSRGLFGRGRHVTVSANGRSAGGGRTFVRIVSGTGEVVGFEFYARRVAHRLRRQGPS